MEKSLKKFLLEKKLIGRWVIIIATLNGAFGGALLMFIMALVGIIG